MTRWCACVGILALCLSPWGDLRAALTTNTWTFAGDGKWEDDAMWSAGVPAGADSAIIITNGGGLKLMLVDGVTASSNAVNGCMTISNLTISAPSPANTLSLKDAGATPLRIRNTLTMTINSILRITNSTVRVEGVSGGFLSNDGIILMQNNSALITTNAGVQLRVGDQDVGTLYLGGGLLLANSVILGRTSNSSGTLTVAGGTNNVSSFLVLAENDISTGTVWVTGGRLVVTNGVTTIGEFGDGQMAVSNGTVLAQTVYVSFSDSSAGTLTIAGGTTRLSGFLDIALLKLSGTATGTVWMTGGQLTVTNGDIAVGFQGAGRMTISNGTLLATNVVVANDPGSSGTLTIAGGTNQFFGLWDLSHMAAATSTVWVTGGRLVVTNNETYVGNLGRGRMTVSNGTWVADRVFVSSAVGSQGTLTIVGGTNYVSSRLVVGGFNCAPTGIVTIAGGRLHLTNSAGNATLEVRTGTLTLSGGSLLVDRFVMTNACGHFVHTGGTLSYGTAVLTTNRDDDADGMSNGFEQDHGLDPLNPGDAALDSDGDGMSNLDEFTAHTDPTNNVSAVRITAITRQGNNIRVDWVMGLGTTTEVQRTTGDAAGSYTTTNFISVGTTFIGGGPGLGSASRTEGNAATNFPALYYRIHLVP